MSSVTIDRTGVVVIGGKKVFPIGFSNPPPLGKKAPSGRDAWEELAVGGASFVRTGTDGWSLELVDGQIAVERASQDAAAAHGLHCLLWLGELTNLPARTAAQPPSANEQLLRKIVTAFKDHPGLGAYKGIDEPRNPFRGKNWVRPEGLVRAREKLRTLDANHPLVITQAPRSPISELVPYRPAFDITGADIYPVSYPPGVHSDSPNHDISVVGDITRKMVEAGGGKPVWMTLQIAWSGAAPSKTNPQVVPRFPSLQEERFMAYQAIVSGARGLIFFGGHLTQVCTPADAKAGWNWTFWQQTLRPLLAELSSSELQPALVAPNANLRIGTKAHTTGVTDVELVARRAGTFLYIIAVKRGGSTSLVDVVGLPPKRDGTALTHGEVLFEYVQQPPPPPLRPERQGPRPVTVTAGGFRDWFGPHDAHVYRFAL